MLDNIINSIYNVPEKEKIMEEDGLIDVESLHEFKGEPHFAELTDEDYVDIFLEEFGL